MQRLTFAATPVAPLLGVALLSTGAVTSGAEHWELSSQLSVEAGFGDASHMLSGAGRLHGPPRTGKSHIAQAIGRAVVQQGHRVLYREAHVLIEELAESAMQGIRKELAELLSTVPLLIMDDLGMRKLPATAAEDLLEIVMRRYERTSTIITSNRPVEDWGELLGDNAAVSAMLDRLLHHAVILKCGPRSYRTSRADLSDGEVRT